MRVPHPLLIAPPFTFVVASPPAGVRRGDGEGGHGRSLGAAHQPVRPLQPGDAQSPPRWRGLEQRLRRRRAYGRQVRRAAKGRRGRQVTRGGRSGRTSLVAMIARPLTLMPHARSLCVQRADAPRRGAAQCGGVPFAPRGPSLLPGDTDKILTGDTTGEGLRRSQSCCQGGEGPRRKAEEQAAEQFSEGETPLRPLNRRWLPGDCQVGSFYKTPKEPVWVVGSWSHFTVLFATTRKPNEQSRSEILLAAAARAFK